MSEVDETSTPTTTEPTESSSSSSSSSSNSSQPAPTDETKPEGESEAGGEDADIEEMKRHLKELEDEEAKIAALQQSIDSAGKSTSSTGGNPASGPEVDARSVYVGSVDYSTTPEELQSVFSACGVVNRVTILCDKFTGHPKGFAYVEFKDAESIENALLLNDTTFKGRQLKVTPKRTNVPAFQLGRGRGRGRGGFAPRGRGGYRGGGYRGGYQGYGHAPPPRFGNRKVAYAPY